LKEIQDQSFGRKNIKNSNRVSKRKDLMLLSIYTYSSLTLNNYKEKYSKKKQESTSTPSPKKEIIQDYAILWALFDEI
jgi:hypothetical protein